MPNHLRSALVFHGIVVIALGLAAGVPFAMVILGQLESDLRAWRMAHLEGVLNGLVMIAFAGAGGVMQLSDKQSRWLLNSLTLAGYGNVVGSIIAAIFGVRGLMPVGPLANIVVVVLFNTAVAGALIALALAGIGARKAMRAR